MEILKERLRLYLEAEKAILSGAQSYQIGDRTLTRASLQTIQSTISDLIVEIQAAEGKGRVKTVVFRD